MNLLSIGRTFALGFGFFFLPLAGRALAQWGGYGMGPGMMGPGGWREIQGAGGRFPCSFSSRYVGKN